MTRDEIFAAPIAQPVDFSFGKDTAAVFDDMLSRSVPFYHEIQRMTSELAADFALEGTNLYDLGCSTATTLLELDPVVPPGVTYVGVDNSPEMLEKAQAKLTAANVTRPHKLVLADLNEVEIQNASVVIMTLTLQFVRPLFRERLMRRIADGLKPGGCLILVEKLINRDPLLNRLFIKYYYAMKQRHGYSDMEISQKREALENVLIPYRLEENRDLVISSGFSSFEVFFRWYNFCGMVAVK